MREDDLYVDNVVLKHRVSESINMLSSEYSKNTLPISNSSPSPYVSSVTNSKATNMEDLAPDVIVRMLDA
jgi:hypothetical protein